MNNFKLNLVFHDIVGKESQIKNRFTVTKDYLDQLLRGLSKSKVFTISKDSSDKILVRLFFDDDYKSLFLIAKPVLDKYGIKAKIGVVTQPVNTNHHLSKIELLRLKQEGFEFCSHGVSHAALCIYKKGVLQRTPSGGEYRNTPSEKRKILSEKEVVFQLVESKKQLEDFVNDRVEEFIYPYGLYNDDIVKILESNKIYKKAYTCDKSLETESCHPFKLPRVLIEYSRMVAQIPDFLTKIKSAN